MIYPGRGLTGLRKAYPAYGSIRTGPSSASARWNDDGAPDSLLRRGGTLTLYAGNGPGGLRRRRSSRSTCRRTTG